jgi:hypothetical protein
MIVAWVVSAAMVCFFVILLKQNSDTTNPILAKIHTFRSDSKFLLSILPDQDKQKVTQTEWVNEMRRALFELDATYLEWMKRNNVLPNPTDKDVTRAYSAYISNASNASNASNTLPKLVEVMNVLTDRNVNVSIDAISSNVLMQMASYITQQQNYKERYGFLSKKIANKYLDMPKLDRPIFSGQDFWNFQAFLIVYAHLDNLNKVLDNVTNRLELLSLLKTHMMDNNNNNRLYENAMERLQNLPQNIQKDRLLKIWGDVLNFLPRSDNAPFRKWQSSYNIGGTDKLENNFDNKVYI